MDVAKCESQDKHTRIILGDDVFTLDFLIESLIDGTKFISCNASDSKVFANIQDNTMRLLVSIPLWSWMALQCHEGAYGEEGPGYHAVRTQDGDFYVVINKVPIDVEEFVGYRWRENDGGVFDSNSTLFKVPYGIKVNVGDYPLLPYDHTNPDNFFDDTTTLFTKWRIQISDEFFGVHSLESTDSNRQHVFAMIPSVVPQMSCPDEDVTRHLNATRSPNEKRRVDKMVGMLRSLGLHARDVHSEHHGIVILNKTPKEFATLLASCVNSSEEEEVQPFDLHELIETFQMSKWVASYIATFKEE